MKQGQVSDVDLDIKPFTPLPWTWQDGMSKSGAIRVIAPVRNEPETVGYERDQNGRYATLACNYFPRLLAALSELADQNTAPSDTLNRARDLLRELGVK